jgi:methylmalonyl-CoA mutase N-terminal domain/subunit
VGGSYHVEYLTDQIEDRAWQLIQKIQSMGGAAKAIEKKFYQTEIAASAYQYQLDIERKEKIVVGVNEFQTGDEHHGAIHRVDESLAKKQVERLKDARRRRDPVAHKASLRDLEQNARSQANVVPAILNCVEAYASVGEIADTLRGVWGEYKE